MNVQILASSLSYPELRLFIAGEWRAANHDSAIDVVDPGSEEIIARLPMAKRDEVDEAAEAAGAAFGHWRRMPAIERAAILRRAAEHLRSDAKRIAGIITFEAGKPLFESQGEVGIAADTLDWFAAEAPRNYGRLVPSRDASQEFRAERVAVGPVAAFCAWNAPLANCVRKIAPALSAGCSVVLKASEDTPAGAIELALALESAGLPKGVLNLVFGDPAAISAQLIAHPAIRKITFTGSTAVGKDIAHQAASRMKPATMELGGHAPVFIFEDVDVDTIAQLAVKAKHRNAGQICFSPTRFFVQDAVHDRFVKAYAKAAKALKVGHGLDPSTEMGPLIHARRVGAMERFCADAEKSGCRLLFGGEPVERKGFFWAPTAYADAPVDADLMNMEPFGPIATINRFETLEEAIREANRLPYGLSTYLFTASRSVVQTFVECVESGTFGLNTFQVVLPETPFGGVRDSGLGREGGSEGMDPYFVTRFTHWA
jgi:succinate-semialdehyde dehydrogenase/glutarate-semialdehyde dehydrogenase